MKLLNTFFAGIIIVLSMLPLAAPQKADNMYMYFHDIASGKIVCHCDAMKDMEEAVKKDYTQGLDVAYIIDCNSADKQTRDHSNQLRASSSSFSSNFPLVHTYIYPQQTYSILTRALSSDTPPPRYSA